MKGREKRERPSKDNGEEQGRRLISWGRVSKSLFRAKWVEKVAKEIRNAKEWKGKGKAGKNSPFQQLDNMERDKRKTKHKQGTKRVWIEGGFPAQKKKAESRHAKKKKQKKRLSTVRSCSITGLVKNGN